MSDALKALERLNTQCESYGMFEYGSQKHADIETIRAALTAQSETGDDLICYECAKEHDHFYTSTPVAGKCCVCGRALLVDRFKVTPPRTEDATKTVTLSKEDFERVKKTLEFEIKALNATAALIDDRNPNGNLSEISNDYRVHSIRLKNKALSILEKEIKP